MEKNEKNIKLIIGLGNPGKDYFETYHNIGHFFIDTIGTEIKSPSLKTDIFMNESGLFVKKELKKLNLKPENLLVVHDDSDIELGKTKLCFGRGSAGHKGVQNIIDQLKTKNFWRLRIGIRPPEQFGQKIASLARRSSVRAKAGEFVLKKISSTNKKVFAKIFTKIIPDIVGVCKA